MKLLLAGAAGFLLIGAGASFGSGKAGDPGRGRQVFQKCYACHAMEPGRNDLSGPNLNAIVGRPIAGERDFDYSKALRTFARREPRWTKALLDEYMRDPEALVPGTDMTFTGMNSASERADLVAYLSQARRLEDGEGSGPAR